MTVLDCPRCGAPLPAPTAGDTVVCKYCQSPLNLGSKSEPRRKRHTAVVRTAWFRAELVWALIAALGFGAWQVQRLLIEAPIPSVPLPEAASAASAQPHSDRLSLHKEDQSPLPSPSRISGKVLLVDGVDARRQDAVVVARYTSADDARFMVAVSGATGQTRWRWLMPAGSDERTERAWADGSVVVRTKDQITRINSATGEVIWHAEAKGSGRLCATATYVTTTSVTPANQAFVWANGRSIQVKPGQCKPLYSTLDAGPNFEYLPAQGLRQLPALKAFTPVQALLPRQGNAKVILGHMAQPAAAQVPFVAVVANRRWVWQREVSTELVAALPEPPLAAVRRESVVVPYWDTQNHSLRLAAFGLENGTRLWDLALNDDVQPLPPTTDIDMAVTLDGAVIVRSLEGRLRAYRLNDGSQIWSTGGT